MALPLLLALLFAGCDQTPPEPERVSNRTRAENASIHVEREHRLSEDEQIRVVIVPGFPMGERCVLYTGPGTSAMQCEEATSRQQE